MKQLVFIILFSITVMSAKAQNIFNEKISFTTTIGTGLTIDEPSTAPFAWQVLGYYHISDRWAIGAGTGLSFYEKMLIPVYADIKFQIGRERKFTPYAEFAIGYSFAPTSNVNGGFFMNPSIGVQYPLRNKMKLKLAVGYEIQELERLKRQTDNYFKKEFAEKLNHNNISIKLGLNF